MSNNGVAAAAEACGSRTSLVAAVEFVCLLRLLKVVRSGLGSRNTQSAFCFAAIKPGFETVQGDMFFIGGEQGFDVF